MDKERPHTDSNTDGTTTEENTGMNTNPSNAPANTSTTSGQHKPTDDEQIAQYQFASSIPIFDDDEQATPSTTSNK